MRIEIDNKSGFCFGVINAIKIAEENLEKQEKLYSLGDIVHNGAEITRLASKGLITISKEEYYRLSNCKVLIRAHGEPPETYQYAKEHNIELIEATCPVVLQLQQLIRKSYEQSKKQGDQIVIFGKKGHAEVIGLNGQTGNNSIIIESKDDLHKINFTRPIILYSQTTKSIEKFQEIAEIIRSNTKGKTSVVVKDTICRQVANRVKHLKEFSAKFDVVIFVAGVKSSNGKFLYSVCREINPMTYQVATPDELLSEWFKGSKSVGICGATSTPLWLMEEVASAIEKRF